MANPPITVRASNILPASGIYDSTPLVILNSKAEWCELRVTYTYGTAGGYPKVRMSVCDTSIGTFRTRTIDANVITIGTGTFADEATTQLYKSGKCFPSPPSGSADYYTWLVYVATASYITFAFAEVGQVASPGTLAADCIFTGLGV